MKSTYLQVRQVMSLYALLPRLHAAVAVLEAPLLTHSRNTDLENRRSFLPRVSGLVRVAGAV